MLSESVTADIDRLLPGLEVKEFSVEASTLQSLQQLIQWVADLALNILAKLPDSRGMSGMNRSTGYDISKDIVALNSIRELLVVMRMWGLIRSQCLPVFSRSAENLDVLATLYKLLTRLTLNPNEPDELLLGLFHNFRFDSIKTETQIILFGLSFRRMLFVAQPSVDSAASTHLSPALYSISNYVLLNKQ